MNSSIKGPIKSSMKILKLLTKSLLVVFAMSTANPVAFAQSTLDAAQYTQNNELIYPSNLDVWIHMGTSLGGDYSEDQFDPEHPGTLGVVQMEPSAYRYFLQNREYADGTMFLLSFFDSEVKSDPQLQGFVQGEMTAQEIHVIDKQRFAEGRGFFLYQTPTQAQAAKVPDGSVCVECHREHGDFDGTFIQFYPTLRP